MTELRAAHQNLMVLTNAIATGHVGRWSDERKKLALQTLDDNMCVRAVDIVPADDLDSVIAGVVKAYAAICHVISDHACTFIANHIEGGMSAVAGKIAEIIPNEHWVLALNEERATIAMTGEAYAQYLADQAEGGVKFQHTEVTEFAGQGWRDTTVLRITGMTGELEVVDQINKHLAAAEATPMLPEAQKTLGAGEEDSAAAQPPALTEGEPPAEAKVEEEGD